MKYTLVNPILDAQIAEIERKIRLSMNGIVSDKMIQSGINYKKNYGVSIPRIKEIASLYTPGHELAQRLWDLQIRETMIMATILQPVELFHSELAHKWAGSFNQIEIIEQACMNLFSKLSYSNNLCLEWIQSDKVWIQVTGFLLAARIYKVLNQREINEIIQGGIGYSITDNFHLYNAVSVCLIRFCRKDTMTATVILKEIIAISHSTLIGQQFISNEVKQEILFLDII